MINTEMGTFWLSTIVDNQNVLIVPNGMGHMDWVRDSWHQSRIVPPRRDLRRLARVRAARRLSRLYLPGGTIPRRPPARSREPRQWRQGTTRLPAPCLTERPHQ